MKKIAILSIVIALYTNSFCMRKRYSAHDLAFYNETKTKVFPETGDLDENKSGHYVSIDTICKSKKMDNTIFRYIFSKCTISGKYRLAVLDAYKDTFHGYAYGIGGYSEETPKPQEVVEIWNFMKKRLEEKLQSKTN